MQLLATVEEAPAGQVWMRVFDRHHLVMPRAGERERAPARPSVCSCRRCGTQAQSGRSAATATYPLRCRLATGHLRARNGEDEPVRSVEETGVFCRRREVR